MLLKLQLGSDISSHPLFEDGFLLQADKLSICQLFIIIFFTFICDVLTRDIAFLQDISLFICDVTALHFLRFL